jgi:hypothetical protein
LVNIAQIQKNAILLTLASVNIFAKKKEFEEEIFYAIFLIYPLFLLTLFRWKKKSLRDIFAFNNNSPQVEHIAKTKKIQAQRKKIK